MGQSKKARTGFKNRLGARAPVVAPVVTLVRPKLKLTTKQCYHNKDCDEQCKKKCITEYCNDHMVQDAKVI